MEVMKRQHKLFDLLPFAFLLPVPLVIIFMMLVPHVYEHYLYLAESFAHGHLYFLNTPPKTMDTFFYRGHYYWPNPPFPVLVMLPFYLLGTWLSLPVSQGLAQLIITTVLFILLVRIFRLYSSKKDALFWAYGFIFSTCFIGVAAVSWSWYFAHVITVFLIFLAYHLYKKECSPVYVGLIYSLVALTRFTAAIGIVFYVLLLLFEKDTKIKITKVLVKRLFLLIAPLVLGLVVLYSYNYVRYGTWKELGYVQNTLKPSMQQARDFGLFNLKHVPGNLYYLLISSPEPVFVDGVSRVLSPPYIKASEMGLSIFFTSPIFLYLFLFTYRRREVLIYFLSSLIILAPILFYFALGGQQYGYRYSLDFLPYLYILLFLKYYENKDKLGVWPKSLIIVSSVWNLFLLFPVFFAV